MHPHLAELGVPLLLHEVVTDLVYQLKLSSEYFAERLGYLLEYDQPVDDGEVAARRHGVEVVAIMLGFGREIAEVDIGDEVRLFRLCHLEVIRREPVAPPARAGVRLHE